MTTSEGVITELLSETPLLARALAKLARGAPGDMAADLRTIEIEFELEETCARTHCYSFNIDGMGNPRVTQLITAVGERVTDYAIPRGRILEALDHHRLHGSTGPLVRLANEARALFTRLSSTGEGGELLLFCMAESLLGYPQLLTKMSLKTAPGVHYHGCDAVHASADERTGMLKLWWGEAKLHGSAAAATTKCLKDLAPFLIEPNSPLARRERDLTLLRHNMDFANPALEGAIRTFLDTRHINNNRLAFGGLCLIGFDHDCYAPDPKSVTADVASRIAKAVGKWKRHARTRLLAEKLETIDLHLFFVPFPSVDDFRLRFRRELGLVD